MSLRMLVVVSTFLLASGCGTLGTEGTSVRDEYPAIKSSITSGVTKRDEIKKRFGEPLMHVEKFGVEVYRAAKGHDVKLDFILYLPVIADINDVIVYLMVQYDSNDVVKDVKWTQLIEENENTSVSMRIDDVVFHSYAPRPDEYLLLVGPSSRQTLFRTAPPGKCLVTFWRDSQDVHLLIDNSLIVKDSYHGPGRVFVQVELAPGHHVLIISTPIFSKKDDFTANFRCQSGDSLYAYLDSANSNGSEVESIKISQEPPIRTYLIEAPMMLYHSGSKVGDY